MRISELLAVWTTTEHTEEAGVWGLRAHGAAQREAQQGRRVSGQQSDPRGRDTWAISACRVHEHLTVWGRGTKLYSWEL